MSLNDNEIIANGNTHQLRNRLRQRSQELNSLAYALAKSLGYDTSKEISIQELVDQLTADPHGR